jgi:RNA polymerase sigma-70 factor (ECF subfamily)
MDESDRGAVTADQDHEWYTDAVRVHLDTIVRYFVRRTSRADVDDLAAEVFAIAWRRRAVVPRDATLPWLYRTAGHLLANHRRRRSWIELDPQTEQPGTNPIDRVGDRDEIVRALAELRPRDREVIMLHAWEGLDGLELGAALGMSRSGAQAALSRARARLRAIRAAASQDS